MSTKAEHRLAIGRILEIGRDPLFRVAYPAHTDWVSTGDPVEPINRYHGARPAPSVSLGGAVRNLLGGRYDLVMLPAIQARTPTDHGWDRVLLRQVLTHASRSQVLINLFSRASGLREVRHFVRDISDYPHIGDSDAGLFPESLLYVKREVLRSDLGCPAHHGSGGIVTYMPMPFDVERYREWMVEEPEKSVDVFFAGKLHSPQRVMARRAAEELAHRGLRVDLPTERLSYLDYLHRLARAWLVLSPRGHGEHCYRHYEALLMGSVPVINHPELPIHYSLEHGWSALFHAPTFDDITTTCMEALAEPDLLRNVAAAGRRLVETEHDVHAICNKLLDLVSVSPPRL